MERTCFDHGLDSSQNVDVIQGEPLFRANSTCVHISDAMPYIEFVFGSFWLTCPYVYYGALINPLPVQLV